MDWSMVPQASLRRSWIENEDDCDALARGEGAEGRKELADDEFTVS